MSRIFSGAAAPDSRNSLDNDPWFVEAAARLDGWSALLERESRVETIEQRLATPVEGAPASDAIFARRLLDDPDFDIVAAARDAVDGETATKARGVIVGAARVARGFLAGDARAWLGANGGELCKLLHTDRVATAAKLRDLAKHLQGVDAEEVARRPDLAPIMAEVLPSVDLWRHQRALHAAIIGLESRRQPSAASAAFRFWPHHDWAADLAEGWPAFYRERSNVASDGTELGAEPFPWGDGSALEVAQLVARFKVIWTPTLGELDRADAQLTRQASRLSAADLAEYERQRREGFPSGVKPKVIEVTRVDPPADVEQRALAAPGRIG